VRFTLRLAEGAETQDTPGNENGFSIHQALLNFNTLHMRDGIKRVVNGL
jgi:hypothetical protein